jgi:hypothetical protein
VSVNPWTVSRRTIATDCNLAPQFVPCVQLDTLIALVSVVVVLLLAMIGIMIWLARQRVSERTPGGAAAGKSYKTDPEGVAFSRAFLADSCDRWTLSRLGAQSRV